MQFKKTLINPVVILPIQLYEFSCKMSCTPHVRLQVFEATEGLGRESRPLQQTLQVRLIPLVLADFGVDGRDRTMLCTPIGEHR